MTVRSHAQEVKPSGKLALSFNLTSCYVNELNISLEIFTSKRKSLMFDGGLVFVNEMLEEQTKDWNNSQLFSEHGYTGRFHYKVFSRKDDEANRWHDYIAPGIIYKHLYYNAQWFTNVLKDKHNAKYFERVYQSRVRTKFGLEFIWGNVYEMNRTFAFDFFYGGGILATFSQRKIIRTIPDSRKNVTAEINDTDESFYVRPSATVGIKLRVRF
jgi:hypothetical protein